ncbi:MAG: leucine-rich repeat protein [Oscillospiraceae bacterium]|nr:leucine-rich repeat protein [Oscillospiraceae bacterium]
MKQKMKKALAMLLVLCFAVSLAPMALAADVETSGTCGYEGDNLTWTLDNGVLTISGTGAMYKYQGNNAPWYELRESIATVVIGDGVTSITENAFRGCSNLASIMIAGSVTDIGGGVFEGCTSLTNVVIPDGVSVIMGATFLNCSGLTSVTMPSSVTYIGAMAFAGCINLTSITIPDSVTEISSYAFQSCRNLTSITIPNGVTVIDVGTFYNCSSLTNITIPDGVTTIYSDAFRGCSNLINITIPDSVTFIGGAFNGCSSLTNITIPDGITNLYSGTFYECSSLTSITMPDSIISIDNSTFYGCSGLSDVYYAGNEDDWNAIEIGTDNEYLTSATIHYNSTGNEDSAISGTCGENVIWTLDTDTGVLTISGEGRMYSASFSEVYYLGTTWLSNASSDSVTHIVIEDGVTSIGDCMFYEFKNLTGITIADSVTSIGSGAFYNCSSLTDIEIPDSVTEIGSEAFHGTPYYTDSEYWSGDVLYIDNWLICANEDISGKYEIDSGTVGIAASAFSDCVELTDVTIPDSVLYIGYMGFDGCSGIEEIILPPNITSVEQMTFFNCTALTNIIIPDGVTALDSGAFAGCRLLTSAVIPSSLESIGLNVFSGTDLSDVYYCGSEAEWEAFKGSLESSMITANSTLFNATMHYDYVIATAPTVSASTSVSSGKITVTFSAEANGSDITGYTIVLKNGDTEIETQTATEAGSVTFTGLTNGTEYTVEVTAASEAGSTTETLTATPKSSDSSSSTVTTASTLTPEKTSNAGSQSYTIYHSAPVYSYLVEVDDGYMRVEYTGSKLTAEYYDSDFTLAEKKYITTELPLFGGFFAGSDAYYFVFGQTNSDENDSTEVIRVVKYSTDWERLGSASLYGANTTIPFRSGSLRMTEAENALYIRTSHQMYASSDGVNHQANLTIEIRESDMEITDYLCGVSNVSTGYVSHSFNQFILVDDSDNLIALDHGDAYPRAAVLFKYDTKAGESTFDYTNTAVYLLNFEGETGENYTGASLGGLEYSETSYLVAGNSVTQDENWDSHTARNVFVAVTSRDDFSEESTTINWITNYDTDGSVSASTPQLVKINDNEFLLMWTVGSTKLYYVYLDEDGNTTSEIYTATGSLSDCQPIVVNGSVVWYCTNSSEPVFYTIDLENPDEVLIDNSLVTSSSSSSSSTSGGSAGGFSGGTIVTIPTTTTTTTSAFTDVDSDSYYADAVAWAVEQGITTGTSNTTFSPETACTRAQAVTFLWRAAGSPEASGENPFADISEDDYYYTAVLWAVENGITTGTSDTAFSPDATCTRAEIVTFLYRASGETAEAAETFTDVTADAWYAEAVAWAAAEGITTGTTETTFTPEASCTRGQIVTFLYRDMA